MIWPLSILSSIAILALTVLIRESMLKTEREARANREMVRTWNPCAVLHDFVIIELKPLDSPAFSCRHTNALYRCRKCGDHRTVLYPGEWEIGSFLKSTDDTTELKRMHGL